MKNTSQYLYVVDTRICGIPCLAGITYYDDAEVEFEILDRKGYKAAWLERKMTKKDEKNVLNDIKEHGNHD